MDISSMREPLAKSGHLLTVLGIETSCDETAAAIVQTDCADLEAASGNILSNIIHSQFDDHADYGGVVPEIAARAHVEKADVIIARALSAAQLPVSSLDAIAVTAGPGLVGGVMVGLTTAKAMAISHCIPLIPINHLAAHALTIRMVQKVDFPYLLLLVSGGHTQLLWVTGPQSYQRLGTTIDDAAGEAFDKTAQLLGLPNPGGPNLEKVARSGEARYEMPRPLLKRPGCDFSFSGMKTATRLLLEQVGLAQAADIAASFQAAAAAHLRARTARAMAWAEAHLSSRTLVIAGGVAANSAVRQQLESLAHEQGWKMLVPDPKLCTDNGAMVAWAGIEMARAGLMPDTVEAFAVKARPRWPLDNNPEGARHGGGKKGPKA